MTAGADGHPVVHDLVCGRYSPVDRSAYDHIVIRADSRYVVDNFDRAFQGQCHV